MVYEPGSLGEPGFLLLSTGVRTRRARSGAVRWSCSAQAGVAVRSPSFSDRRYASPAFSGSRVLWNIHAVSWLLVAGGIWFAAHCRAGCQPYAPDARTAQDFDKVCARAVSDGCRVGMRSLHCMERVEGGALSCRAVSKSRSRGRFPVSVRCVCVELMRL